MTIFDYILNVLPPGHPADSFASYRVMIRTYNLALEQATAETDADGVQLFLRGLSVELVYRAADGPGDLVGGSGRPLIRGSEKSRRKLLREVVGIGLGKSGLGGI